MTLPMLYTYVVRESYSTSIVDQPAHIHEMSALGADFS